MRDLSLGESYPRYPDVNAQRIGTAFTIHQALRSATRPADDRKTHSRPSVPHSDSSLAFSLALRSRTFAHLAHSLRIDHMDFASHTDRQDFPSHPYDSIPHVYKTDRQHPPIIIQSPDQRVAWFEPSESSPVVRLRFGHNSSPVRSR